MRLVLLLARSDPARPSPSGESIISEYVITSQVDVSFRDLYVPSCRGGGREDAGAGG